MEKRVGNMIYIIKGPQLTHLIHLNQIKKRLSFDVDCGTPEEKVVRDVIMILLICQYWSCPQNYSFLKRKRKMSDFIVVNITTSGQIKLVSDGNEWILRFPLGSSITVASQ